MIFWVATLAATVLAGVLIFGTEASSQGKAVVGGAIVLSVILQRVVATPPMWVVGTLLQVTVAIGVMIYLKLKW